VEERAVGSAQQPAEPTDAAIPMQPETGSVRADGAPIGKEVGADGGGGVLLYVEQATSQLTQPAGMPAVRTDPV